METSICPHTKLCFDKEFFSIHDVKFVGFKHRRSTISYYVIKDGFRCNGGWRVAKCIWNNRDCLVYQRGIGEEARGTDLLYDLSADNTTYNLCDEYEIIIIIYTVYINICEYNISYFRYIIYTIIIQLKVIILDLYKPF